MEDLHLPVAHVGLGAQAMELYEGGEEPQLLVGIQQGILSA
jgi:hypothetical protein